MLITYIMQAIIRNIEERLDTSTIRRIERIFEFSFMIHRKHNRCRHIVFWKSKMLASSIEHVLEIQYLYDMYFRKSHVLASNIEHVLDIQYLQQKTNALELYKDSIHGI